MGAHRPRLSCGIAAAAMLVMAASCSSASSASGGSGGNAPCDSPGVTPNQVKIGFVYPATGPSSSALSAARAGLDARIGLANAQGGIHGRQITYEWRDDEGTASATALAIDELVQQQNVFGLVSASASLGDSVNTMSQQGIPVTGVAIEPTWAGHENMFTFVYSASPMVVGRYIHAAHGTKVAIITGDPSALTSDNTKAYEASLRAAGASDVEAFSYVAATGNPTQVANRIASFGADALLGITAPDDFAQIVQATRTAGAHVAVSVVLTGYDRGVIASASGKALAGVSMPVFFRPFEAGGPPIQQYEDAVERYAPESGSKDQQFAMFTYIGTDIFLRGLELAGPCPTRAGFIKALRGVSSYDAGGLIAPIDLRDDSGQPLACYAFVQVSPDGTSFQVVRNRICADGSTG